MHAQGAFTFKKKQESKETWHPNSLTIEADLQFIAHKNSKAWIEKHNAKEGSSNYYGSNQWRNFGHEKFSYFDPNNPIISQIWKSQKIK